jgi:hypothetical protein
MLLTAPFNWNQGIGYSDLPLIYTDDIFELPNNMLLEEESNSIAPDGFDHSGHVDSFDPYQQPSEPYEWGTCTQEEFEQREDLIWDTPATSSEDTRPRYYSTYANRLIHSRCPHGIIFYNAEVECFTCLMEDCQAEARFQQQQIVEQVQVLQQVLPSTVPTEIIDQITDNLGYWGRA